MYWGTGNPNPDFYGDNRKGDNLYSGSLLALDADTGTLKWHFQFTPHDTHDWDANQIPVLADITLGGEPRKVVMVANRNGFLYVLDRVTGKFMHAHPFVRQTWAKEIGADGRPVELPDQRPTRERHDSRAPICSAARTSCRRRSIPRRDGSTCRHAKPARSSSSEAPPEGYKAGDRVMGGRLARAPDPPYRRAARDRPADRRAQVGNPTPDAVMGRRPLNCRRRRLQRHQRRRLHRRRLADRQGAVPVSDRRADLRAADDVSDRRAPVCGHALRHDDDRIRPCPRLQRPRSNARRGLSAVIQRRGLSPSPPSPVTFGDGDCPRLRVSPAIGTAELATSGRTPRSKVTRAMSLPSRRTMNWRAPSCSCVASNTPSTTAPSTGRRSSGSQGRQRHDWLLQHADARDRLERVQHDFHGGTST